MPELVIFDLNGVLINKHGKFSKKLEDTDLIINFAFENYDVAVWSSAKLDNINKTLSKILTSEQISKLVFIFSQENCVAVKGKNKYYPIFTKPLFKVWEIYTEYGVDNTIIVDDSIEKIKGYENNHMLPQDFLKLCLK